MSSQGLTAAGHFTLPGVPAAPTLDGSATGNAAASTTVTASITTTKTNDIVIACVFVNGSPATVTPSGGGLSWNTRINGVNKVWEFWALAASTLTAQTITITFNSAMTAGLIVSGWNGCNTSNPFDPGASPPATGQTAASVTVGTIYSGNYIPNAMAIAFFGMNTTGETWTVGTSWTSVASLNTSVSALLEYQSYSTGTLDIASATWTAGAQASMLLDLLSGATYSTIQPASNVEWDIHNISYEQGCVVAFTDGTNYVPIFILGQQGNGILQGLSLHLSNSFYLVIYGTAPYLGTWVYGYNGIRLI